jgi:hypothetical protein
MVDRLAKGYKRVIHVKRGGISIGGRGLQRDIRFRLMMARMDELLRVLNAAFVLSRRREEEGVEDEASNLV